jgi:hypothetical protein
MNKIDILFNIDELISVIDDSTKTYKISSFTGDDLIIYQSFIDMVNSKNNFEYNQIMISDYYVKRYVLIFQEYLILKKSEEILYDNLSDAEKIIFDNFYNTFTTWQ